MSHYSDRHEAGRRLAEALAAHKAAPDTVVLALPRGGVPVAAVVARALDLPLDLMLVRKLGVPGHEELAMGAIASGGVQVMNEDIVRKLRLPPASLEAAVGAEMAELKRREKRYRGEAPPPELQGRTVILIDDGCATGANMRAAVTAARRQGAARVVVAVPVAPPETIEALEALADEVVCPLVPAHFMSIGGHYLRFDQLADEEVTRLLEEVARQRGAASSGDSV